MLVIWIIEDINLLLYSPLALQVLGERARDGALVHVKSRGFQQKVIVEFEASRRREMFME